MIVDPDDFDTYIRTETGGSDPAMTAQALAAAEGFVIQHCHRSFELAGDTPTPRVFKPLSPCSLWVDDFIDPTTLTVSNNGVAVASTNWELHPLNGRDSGFPVPYQEIELFGLQWNPGPTGWTGQIRALITVTARWGWAADPGIPDPVIEGIKLIGKDYVQQRTTKFGIVETGFGPATAGRNWAALRLLAPFRRGEAFGF